MWLTCVCVCVYMPLNCAPPTRHHKYSKHHVGLRVGYVTFSPLPFVRQSGNAAAATSASRVVSYLMAPARVVVHKKFFIKVTKFLILIRIHNEAKYV